MTGPAVRYDLDERGRFIIESYNWAKAFSSFFPGIAGKWGVPLWVYYVSKGQAVCSVGYRDKNGQILEFNSFNKATRARGVPADSRREDSAADGHLARRAGDRRTQRGGRHEGINVLGRGRRL